MDDKLIYTCYDDKQKSPSVDEKIDYDFKNQLLVWNKRTKSF